MINLKANWFSFLINCLTGLIFVGSFACTGSFGRDKTFLLDLVSLSHNLHIGPSTLRHCSLSNLFELEVDRDKDFNCITTKADCAL